MMLFAGKELSQKIVYLKSQGKELGLSINYPNILKPLVKFYISIFGIPEIGFQERFNFFQRCIKNLDGKIFIDAGCGNGIYSRFVAEKFPKAQVYAFDNEGKLITLSKKISPQKNIHFFIHDLTKPNRKLANQADVVFCLDVLEHIRDYKKALKNIDQMIKKNGYLILHLPLSNQRRWFKLFQKWQHQTHEYEGFEEKKLLNELKNYQIIEKRGTFGAIGSLVWEINIILFQYLPPAGALFFPLLRLSLFLDRILTSKKYNCLGILAQKL